MADKTFVGYVSRGHFNEGKKIHVRISLSEQDINSMIKRMKDGAPGTFDSDKYGKTIKLEVLTSRDGENLYCQFDEFVPRTQPGTVPQEEKEVKEGDLPF